MHHPIALAAREPLPEGWAFWKTQDLPILNHATRLVVLRLPGWEESEGVGAEIAFAKMLRIPVDYADPEPE
jgi:hypothetical protein